MKTAKLKDIKEWKTIVYTGCTISKENLSTLPDRDQIIFLNQEFIDTEDGLLWDKKAYEIYLSQQALGDKIESHKPQKEDFNNKLNDYEIEI